MSRPRRLVLAAATLALWGLLPGAASGADLVDVSGTVTRDGSPVSDVSVTAQVDGSDIVVPATTDATGAWSLRLEAAPGDAVTVRATAPTVTGSPDARGCVHSDTATGKTSVTIDGASVTGVQVVLDTVLSSTVCSATATPGPKITPPATDAVGPGRADGPGTGILVALGALALAVAAGFGAATRRRGRVAGR